MAAKLREGDIFYALIGEQYFIYKVLRLDKGKERKMHLLTRGPVNRSPLAEEFDRYPTFNPHSYEIWRSRDEVAFLGNHPISPAELEGYLQYLKFRDYEAYLLERGQDPEDIYHRATESLERGMSCYRQGAYDIALRHFNKALKLYPGLHFANLGRGYCYLGLEDLELAWQDLRIAYRHFPQDDALGRLLVNLCLESNLPDMAAGLLEKLLAAHPDDPELIMHQGYVHLDHLEFDQAWDRFRQAHELAPESDPQYLYNYACYHAVRYEREAALDWLHLALKKGYDDPAYLMRDRHLRSLKGSRGFRRLVEEFFPERVAIPG